MRRPASDGPRSGRRNRRARPSDGTGAALPAPTEREEQAAIVGLLRALGAAVWVLGTTRPRGDHPGTCQTPGLPDLIAALPATRQHPAQRLEIEVKRRGGRLRPAQAVYRAHALACGIAHVVGTRDAVLAWLRAEGRVR